MYAATSFCSPCHARADLNCRNWQPKIWITGSRRESSDFQANTTAFFSKSRIASNHPRLKKLWYFCRFLIARRWQDHGVQGIPYSDVHLEVHLGRPFTHFDNRTQLLFSAFTQNMIGMGDCRGTNQLPRWTPRVCSNLVLGGNITQCLSLCNLLVRIGRSLTDVLGPCIEGMIGTLSIWTVVRGRVG